MLNSTKTVNFSFSLYFCILLINILTLYYWVYPSLDVFYLTSELNLFSFYSDHLCPK